MGYHLYSRWHNNLDMNVFLNATNNGGITLEISKDDDKYIEVYDKFSNYGAIAV